MPRNSLNPGGKRSCIAPKLSDYCSKNFNIRWENSNTLYLLQRSQLNGSHAELFTYCLQKKLAGKDHAFSVLQSSYQTVTDTYSEPYLLLFSKPARKRVAFRVDFTSRNEYQIRHIPYSNDDYTANLEDTLKAIGFVEETGWLQLISGHPDIESALMNLDQALSAIT